MRRQTNWSSGLEAVPPFNLRAVPNRLNYGAGPFRNVPAHTRHRVTWTNANEKTVWLAIHYEPRSPLGRVDGLPRSGILECGRMPPLH